MNFTPYKGQMLRRGEQTGEFVRRIGRDHVQVNRPHETTHQDFTTRKIERITVWRRESWKASEVEPAAVTLHPKFNA